MSLDLEAAYEQTCRSANRLRAASALHNVRVSLGPRHQQDWTRYAERSGTWLLGLEQAFDVAGSMQDASQGKKPGRPSHGQRQEGRGNVASLRFDGFA